MHSALRLFARVVSASPAFGSAARPPVISLASSTRVGSSFASRFPFTKTNNVLSAARPMATAASSSGSIPAPPSGSVTDLMVITSRDHADSALVRRLADPDGGVLPPGRFAVHVGCALDDFPSAVLDDPDGRPAALLWWFGDAAVMDAVLRRPAASRVAWIHSGAAGVEHILKHPEIRSAPAPLTNAKGAFSASLGEWSIFAFMWFAKRVGAMRAAQAEGRWMRAPVGMLQGKTVTIVGYGDIGRAVAIRAKAMGMRVVAMRRDPSRNDGDPNVDETLPLTKLHDAMSAGDFVVLSLPHTPETEGMVDAAALAAMRLSGVLVNVGRGAVVDEDALVDALRREAILGAALDVTAVEPLPEGHPFYALKNCLMSFHCADLTEDYFELSAEVFARHARAYVDGATGTEGAWNVVDKRAGY